MKIYTKLILSTTLVLVVIFSVFAGIKYVRERILGYSVNTGYTTSLYGQLSATATSSIRVTSSKLINGEELTPSYPMYFEIEPENTGSVEIIECWNFASSTTSVTLQDCNRGLSFSAGTSTSTISGNNKSHAGGSKVVMSDVHYVFEQLVDRNSQELITALKRFTEGLNVGSNGRIDYSGGILRGSNDGGVSFFALSGSSASNTPGRGLEELTAGRFDMSTSTRALGAGGVEFFNWSGNTASVRVAVSSTSPFYFDFADGIGRLGVTSTWFAVDGRTGLLGSASTTWILDADNTNGSAATTGLVFETGTSNQSTDLRIFLDPNDNFKIKLQAYPSASSTITLGGIIPGHASSTVPRSFAAGLATQDTDSSPTAANLTINHNLGIIPAKIKITAVQGIYSIAGEGTACCGTASTTASTGVWLNGAMPTVTPGANSSTYALPLNVSIGGAGSGSTTNTVMIVSPTNGRNFARGVVTDVTSSTFVINFTLLNYSNTNLSPIRIQWEVEQ